jgi:hypothetical protein
MITRRNLFFGPALATVFSLGIAVPGFAQSLSVRSVVKWPMHDELSTAFGGGVQLRSAGKFIFDIQGAAGTERHSPCGGLVFPGTDCTPVDHDMSFFSMLVGYPAASASSGKWRLDVEFLGGMSILSYSGAHLTGAFGLEGSRGLTGSLRIGALTRASLLFPPFSFRGQCDDCPEPRDDMIPAIDFGFMVKF